MYGTVSEIIERLQGYDADTVLLMPVWGVEDVLQCADDVGEAITDKQALSVLALCHHYHDANMGINWDTIRVAIDMVKE